MIEADDEARPLFPHAKLEWEVEEAIILAWIAMARTCGGIKRDRYGHRRYRNLYKYVKEMVVYDWPSWEYNHTGGGYNQTMDDATKLVSKAIEVKDLPRRRNGNIESAALATWLRSLRWDLDDLLPEFMMHLSLDGPGGTTSPESVALADLPEDLVTAIEAWRHFRGLYPDDRHWPSRDEGKVADWIIDRRGGQANMSRDRAKAIERLLRPAARRRGGNYPNEETVGRAETPIDT